MLDRRCLGAAVRRIQDPAPFCGAWLACPSVGRYTRVLVEAFGAVAQLVRAGDS